MKKFLLAISLALTSTISLANWLAHYILETQADNGQTYSNTIYFGQTNLASASTSYGLEDALAPPFPPTYSGAHGETTPDNKAVSKNVYSTNNLPIYNNYIEDKNITATNRTLKIRNLPSGTWILRKYSDDLYQNWISDLSITNNGDYNFGTNSLSFKILEIPNIKNISVSPNSTNTDLTVTASYHSNIPTNYSMRLYTKSDLSDTNETWTSSGDFEKESDNTYTITASNLVGKTKFAKTVIEEK